MMIQRDMEKVLKKAVTDNVIRQYMCTLNRDTRVMDIKVQEQSKPEFIKLNFEVI